MENRVEAIIFDLGKVIIDVDFRKSISAFEELGVQGVHQIMGGDYKEAVFDKFETGKLQEHEFREFIRSTSGLALTDQQIDKAWKAMLGDIPGERLQLIKQIGQNFSTFLLSNTNPIHMKAIYDYVEENHPDYMFSSLFRSEYYSFRVGKRKPDLDIFRQILGENNLQADKTLFIDDSSEHIASAQRLDIRVSQVNDDKDLVGILKNLKQTYALQ